MGGAATINAWLTTGIINQVVQPIKAGEAPSTGWHGVTQSALELSGALWAMPKANFLAQVLLAFFVHLSGCICQHSGIDDAGSPINGVAREREIAVYAMQQLLTNMDEDVEQRAGESEIEAYSRREWSIVATMLHAISQLELSHHKHRSVTGRVPGTGTRAAGAGAGGAGDSDATAAAAKEAKSLAHANKQLTEQLAARTREFEKSRGANSESQSKFAADRKAAASKAAAAEADRKAKRHLPETNPDSKK